MGQNVCALTFIANGEYLATGSNLGVGVWRVKDGKQVARMETRFDVVSLAASKNNKWIAAGTKREMVVWNAETHEQVLKHEEGIYVRGVDFSPDSTRLVAGTDHHTAIVWDLATGKQIQTLHHRLWVIATKYAPRGDRIATADRNGSVRVWDGNDGRLLIDIDVKVFPFYNTGLLWSNDHLLVASDQKIKEFDASTGSKVSEWLVPGTNEYSYIALPKHEQYIAFSAKRTTTFWDTSTHNKLPLTLQHPGDIRSTAFSPDARILAIGGGGKITLSPVSTISCWVISSLNSFLVPSICTGLSTTVSPTPYFPRTRHSNRQRYTQIVASRSPRKCRSVIDCVDQPVAESEPSSTR